MSREATARMSPDSDVLDGKEAAVVARYRPAANYLVAAQIYLCANPLLDEPLKPEHIKDRLLGHWGAAPGLPTLELSDWENGGEYSLDRRAGARCCGESCQYVSYLEGTLSEYFPELTQDRGGLTRFVTWFS